MLQVSVGFFLGSEKEMTVPRRKVDIALGPPPYSKMSDFPSVSK